MTDPLRIGILGAANIAPMALVRPARELPELEVAAVAARSPEKARRFAQRHGVPRVHDSYEDLVADPTLDAIYNPLPNGLHCEWTVRALEAGKHVLCEKPLANNAEEALRMVDAAERSGKILVEAFHYRYHPLAGRIREILDGGEIGDVRHVEAALCIPFLKPGDIRFDYALGGGALMDTGCYTVNLVRFLSGNSPAPRSGGTPEILSANATKLSPQVDRAFRGTLRFQNGVTARITCSLLSWRVLQIGARVIGERGELRVFNPIAPHLAHRLTVIEPGGRRSERLRGDTTYTHQARAFAAKVRGEDVFVTDAEDGIANMRVIDALYEKAGLPLRGAAT